MTTEIGYRRMQRIGDGRDMWAVTVGGEPVGFPVDGETEARLLAEWLRSAMDGIRLTADSVRRRAIAEFLAERPR